MRDATLIALFVLAFSTYYHAKQAHMHAHEAACAAGHEATCQFIETWLETHTHD